MLSRPPDADAADTKRAKRERRRLAQRDYRQRVNDHAKIAPVRFDGAIINLLIHTLHELDPAHAKDRKKVGEAIARALQETAKAEGW